MMKFMLATILLVSTAAQAQYYGPYGPPRGWMPMGPPQRAYRGEIYPNPYRYDDGRFDYLYRRYNNPLYRPDEYGDPGIYRQPYSRPPRGGYPLDYPYR